MFRERRSSRGTRENVPACDRRTRSSDRFSLRASSSRLRSPVSQPASQLASQAASRLWGRSLARTLKYRGFLFFSCYTYRLAAPTYFAPACPTKRCTPHHCGNSSRDVSRALLASRFYSSSFFPLFSPLFFYSLFPPSWLLPLAFQGRISFSYESSPASEASLSRSLPIVALPSAGFSFLFRRCGRSRRHLREHPR